MEKYHKNYNRYMALKWDVEHGVILTPWRLKEFKQLKEDFEK